MIYFDLETTVNGGPNKDSPEAHWSSNRVLLCGWSPDGDEIVIDDHLWGIQHEIEAQVHKHGRCTLVAHNAKFDIKYLMRDHPELPWDCIDVWDTMTWEYLNSGHRETMISLEDAASKHGVAFSKSLDLGALLAAGVKMEDIDTTELTNYLIADVEVLSKLHKVQSAEYLPWMDYILPLAEMELNGLLLNREGAKDMAYKLQGQIDESYQHIRDYIIGACQWQDGSEVSLDDFSDIVKPKSKYIKPTANRTLSFLLTGEPNELKITQKWRLSLKGQPLLSSMSVDKIYQDIESSNLGYPMDEETVEAINMELGNNVEMLEHLIRHRKATKVVNTYLLPMLQQAGVEGTVHPKLNTAITSTGRLSSSQPNGQNMPPEVRELIIASEGQELSEIDYSQLEMVGAATLSRDEQLIYDLSHGVDVHKNTATSVFGAALAEEKRKLAKNVNFGVLYGGKAYGLSKQTGVDKGTIQDLINAFYSAYPGIREWQKELHDEVINNMEAHDVKNGEQRYRSDYILPDSGRLFRFIENEAPSWLRAKTGRKWSFSPNHTANYPIQGFAGGDIVMYGLYHLWREGNWKVLLTVHDSILIEHDKGEDLTKEVESMCKKVESKFNLPVKLHCDIETGTNWR
jgi:DNA polymerase I-like protein with 3'-5' exonuclease and polymerase domains